MIGRKIIEIINWDLKKRKFKIEIENSKKSTKKFFLFNVSLEIISMIFFVSSFLIELFSLIIFSIFNIL